MSLPTPLEMMGAPGSPYTRKVRSLLRYRQIPYRLIIQGSEEHLSLPRPKVELLPTFYFPNDDGSKTPVTDSTPLIRRFEREFEGRSVIPSDPVVALLDALLEDYADEWLTRPMFHYRWAYAADVEKAASILPLWRMTNVTNEQVAPFSKMIAERQISRLGVVGSNEVTKPVIEDSYVRFLDAFDALLQKQPFLLGDRPSSSDFGFFGQLTCLAIFDPTPSAICVERTPRIYAWVEATEDLSGHPGDAKQWVARDGVSDEVRALLAEVGRTHAPFLVANAAAVEAKAETLETEIDGKPWKQKPFPYQAKCLRWLREQYGALSADDRKAADTLLTGTGCEQIFAG